MAIVGCGAIGSYLTPRVAALEGVEKVLLLDEVRVKAERLAAEVDGAEVATAEEMLETATLLVEAASQAAVSEYVPRALEAGLDVVLLSVGAFHDEALWRRVCEAAAAGGRRVYIPSGALAGLDGVLAAAEGSLERVTLTTLKPPRALGLPEGTRTTLFEGPAREAVRRYPLNVNVAATASLAGLGMDRTIVRIEADPEAERNVHRLTVEGDFGRLEARVENVPSPENPRTSHLAALSALALIRRLLSGVFVGT